MLGSKFEIKKVMSFKILLLLKDSEIKKILEVVERKIRIE